MPLPLIPLALSLVHFAPLLAKVLGGEPSEQTAEKVVAVAKAITGSDHAHEIMNVLRTDPKAVLDFQRAVGDIVLAEERAHLSDRQSARSRDVALIKGGRSSFRADVMVVSAAVGLVACLAALIVFQQELPGETVGIISTIAGIFGACLKDAYAFEFGSSRGSREKDLHVATLLGHL